MESLTVRDSADQLERIRRLVRHALGVPFAQLWDHGSPPDGGAGSRHGDNHWEGPLPDIWKRVLESGEPVILAAEMSLRMDANGGPAVQPAAFIGVPVRSRSGALLGCLCAADIAPREWSAAEKGILQDLADLVATELTPDPEADERHALENVVRMLSTAVETMQLGVTLTDFTGRIIYTNPAEARMHGFEVEELVGQHARILGPPELTRGMPPGRTEQATSWTRETINVRKDGSRFPVLLWSDVVANRAGKPIGVVTCCEDITERKRAEQALREVALRDALTGLPNRVYFLDRLNQAIQELLEDETRGFAVLFLDLDRFKVVNDSLGHHVGDRMLGIIADRLLGCLRPGDTVARFGGDEFAVLLEGPQDLEEVKSVAERIQDELAAPVHLDGYELFTSASIGIVLGSEGMDQPEYIWRSADMAMYRAKALGNGRFEIFDRAMHAQALTRLQLETDLRRALERSEFQLHYQPVVELAGGSIVGFEALLRWEHPLRGMVPPDEIIPLAEETGLILPIGAWVLEEACARLAEWQALRGGDEPLWISVNLSGKQLTQSDLLDTVERAIRSSGIAPTSLKLEITESAVVENTEHAAHTLLELKALGVQLLMDDFGTGYSSLSYLHRLPLDALKIDRSFVSRMERGDQHTQLVETIVNLAESVRVQVVGEGVTTTDQLEILRELGCELAQGFLFSRPLPLAEAQELLATARRW